MPRRTLTIMAALLGVVVFAVVLYGRRDDVQTVTPKELDLLKHHYQEPKLSTWYYQGSKNGYDYFAHLDLPAERHYRVSSQLFYWQLRTPLTANRKKWLHLPWGVHDPNFSHDTNYSRTIPKE